jgi:hypothetical protein
MFLYTVIEAVVAVIAGILIAVCTKKAEGISYGKLDKIGQVTNILLLLFYVGFLSAFGCNSNPRHDVSGNSRMDRSNIMASAALFCGIGIGLTVILFFLFYENLLSPLN